MVTKKVPFIQFFIPVHFGSRSLLGYFISLGQLRAESLVCGDLPSAASVTSAVLAMKYSKSPTLLTFEFNSNLRNQSGRGPSFFYECLKDHPKTQTVFVLQFRLVILSCEIISCVSVVLMEICIFKNNCDTCAIKAIKTILVYCLTEVIIWRQYFIRFSACSLIELPSVEACPTLGERAFQSAAPYLWNALPSTLRR